MVIFLRILLVEDEIHLAEALAYTLRKNNYGVDIAYDGLTGQEMAETGLFNLIILDRMLPGKEGLEILKDIRKKGITAPVLVLTAKDSIRDKIEGLDSGADDYLIKPFSKDELLARIRALSRRQSDLIENNEIRIGTVLFNPLKGTIECSGKTTKLSSKESQLLEILLRNRNKVVTKEQILDKIWGFYSDVELNNIEVYLSYLRKKLSAARCNIVIETFRRSGYCLTEAQEHV